MPRKNKNARAIKYSKSLKIRPSIKFIDTRRKDKDDISPGRLVCGADYIERVV